MDKICKLGNNIRSLRIANGETQEQLGQAIGVEKNTISYYENGKREPSKDILSAIASYYMVSVEEILSSDLSGLGKIVIDQNVLWENIDIVLPAACSDTALLNKHFRKAYTIHQTIFEQLKNIDMDGMDKIDVCIDEYFEAYESTESKVEAAANFIGLFYLLLFIMKVAPVIIQNKPSALVQLSARDTEVRNILDNSDSSFEEDAKEIVDELDDIEMSKFLKELLTVVKKTDRWSELADYYLALRYAWNLVDNDLEFGINKRIGVEMLYSFESVKKLYAHNFLKLNLSLSK